MDISNNRTTYKFKKELRPLIEVGYFAFCHENRLEMTVIRCAIVKKA